jgi:hypothetical protein
VFNCVQIVGLILFLLSITSCQEEEMETNASPTIVTTKVCGAVCPKIADLQNLEGPIVMTLKLPLLGSAFHVFQSTICEFVHDSGVLLGIVVDGHKKELGISMNVEENVAAIVATPIAKKKKLMPSQCRLVWTKAVNNLLLTNPSLARKENMLLPDGQPHPMAKDYVQVGPQFYEFLRDKNNLGALAGTAGNVLSDAEKKDLKFEIIKDTHYPNAYLIPKNLNNFLKKFEAMSMAESGIFGNTFRVEIWPIHSEGTDINKVSWKKHFEMLLGDKGDLDVESIKYKTRFKFVIQMKLKGFILDKNVLLSMGKNMEFSTPFERVFQSLKINAEGKPIVEIEEDSDEE